MTLQLKTVLQERRMSQQALGEACGISQAAVAQIINHNIWPKKPDADVLKPRILKALDADVSVFEECRATAATDGTANHEPLNQKKALEAIMLLRKQVLTLQARRHFKLPRDPFADPVESADVFLSPDIRDVRENLYQVARFGGFMALVGESGSGKSTLREDLIDRIQREEQAIIVIEPYVLASEANDKHGKTLKSTHIAEAIMAAVAPLASLKSSPEARFRQVHAALRESARAGHSHVLIIEEAHALPFPTLKHLKRFRELKDGLRPLLSVILIGQDELAIKLSEHNPEVREVVQRIELVTLPTLGTHFSDYLKHRFKRSGIELNQVIDQQALEALRMKLTSTRGDSSLLYPLAMHNVLTAAMNRAADLGIPTVTADLVKAV